MNLELVSPTYSDKIDHIEWFAEFLNACYLMRDDEDPCTVEDIDYFATHEYFCSEDMWRSAYTPETGTIITHLISALEDLMANEDYDFDWSAYVNARSYMVTETDCTWDPYPDYLPESAVHCERITGQADGYGAGSVAVMMELPNIHSFYWFIMWKEFVGRNTHELE